MKKNKREANIVFGSIIALLLTLILVSIFFIVRLGCSYIRSRNANKAVAQSATQTVTPAPVTTPDLANASDEAEATPFVSEIPITVDWDELYQVNHEIVAWLYCEGTPINYPVVKHSNNEYYTTHNSQKKKDSSAALFFDYRNTVGADQENMIIYGHRMKDDSMFGILSEYAKESYYEAHPVMYLLTPTKNFRIDLFACRTIEADIRYFPTTFSTREAFLMYASKAESQSYWQRSMQLENDSAALATLVTCSYYNGMKDPRLQVLGWVTPIE